MSGRKILGVKPAKIKTCVWKTRFFWVKHRFLERKNFAKMLKNIKKVYFLRKITKNPCFSKNFAPLTTTLNFFSDRLRGVETPLVKPSPHAHALIFVCLDCWCQNDAFILPTVS